MAKIFRDLLKIKIRPQKNLADYMVTTLIEMIAADYCKIQLGKDWEDLNNIEQRKVIEAVKEELNKKTPVS